MLILGAGGDNQAHVTRPRTAQPSLPQEPSQGVKRVNSQLETITEKVQEEGAFAKSQGFKAGGFDIEASHSFSMRNFGKEKPSVQFLESIKAEGDGGKESAMSNYSRIRDESAH